MLVKAIATGVELPRKTLVKNSRLIKKIVAMLAVLITLLATPTLAVDPLSDQQPALGTEVRLFEARADDSAGPDAVVVSWNAIALRTVIQVARQNQPQSQMYLARIQAAVYNAVVAIEGSCQPYKSNLTAQLLKSIPLA